jgi:signal transduction histidine kinase
MDGINSRPVLSPEILVPRLGETLLKMGLLEEDGLRKVLKLQQARAAEGRAILLGEAALELGLLDRPTLDRAVTEQIIALRNALEEANHSLERRVQERTIELRDALHRLSELNQLKANFISNVSHELRTPLTHLKGYLDLFAEGGLGPLSEDQARALEVCRRSSERLQSLIDDLLMFSQASQGTLTLEYEAVDLEHLCRQAVMSAVGKAEDRGIRLEAGIAADLPPARADGVKVAWVLAQLLDNGIKYTGRGGTVSLSAAEEATHPGRVRLTVRDTGIGIAPEHLAEIFEPFHQLDSSSTRREGGTGLGLALVREIIQAHGSRLEVLSQVDSGTEISFTLLAMDASQHPTGLETEQP